MGMKSTPPPLTTLISQNHNTVPPSPASKHQQGERHYHIKTLTKITLQRGKNNQRPADCNLSFQFPHLTCQKHVYFSRARHVIDKLRGWTYVEMGSIIVSSRHLSVVKPCGVNVVLITLLGNRKV